VASKPLKNASLWLKNFFYPYPFYAFIHIHRFLEKDLQQVTFKGHI